MGPRLAAWELDASLCVFLNAGEMAVGRAQAVCLGAHCSLSARGRPALISGFNAIMLVGAASFSLWHHHHCSCCSWKSLEGETHAVLSRCRSVFLVYLLA